MPAMKIKPTPKSARPPLTTSFQVRASPAYLVWLRDLSDHTMVPASTIVRDALARWAKDRRFKPRPPAI